MYRDTRQVPRHYGTDVFTALVATRNEPLVVINDRNFIRGSKESLLHAFVEAIMPASPDLLDITSSLMQVASCAPSSSPHEAHHLEYIPQSSIDTRHISGNENVT